MIEILLFAPGGNVSSMPVRRDLVSIDLVGTPVLGVGYDVSDELTVYFCRREGRA